MVYKGGMAYSQELRDRIVRGVKQGKRSQRQIAEDFGVSKSCVEEMWRRYRETGSSAIKVWRHGPVQKLAEKEDNVREAVKLHPDATLAELKEYVGKATGRTVSARTMSRVMARLGITRKKRALTPRNATHRR